VNVGDVIDGKYELVRMLGEGGMGRVFGARHAVLGSAVAIKILKRAAEQPDVARRFLREARAAVRLHSDHVARVIDVGQLATGEPFMVMELLEGTDLATQLRRGPLPTDRALRYLIEACDGVAEAHRHGITHRDLKPSNLFLATRPGGASVIKVLDFGIATAATDDVDHGVTTTSALLGSPAYMSPEQLRSSKHVDPRSDVWSLGVTLYELLAGKHPFGGPTFTALSIAIATEPHPPLAGVSPELAAIVDRCLEKEPRDRYAGAAELGDALARFAVAASGTTAQLSAEYRPPVARRRAWPAVAMVCAIASAGIVVFVMRADGDPPPSREVEAPPVRAVPADAAIAVDAEERVAAPAVDAAAPDAAVRAASRRAAVRPVPVDAAVAPEPVVVTPAPPPPPVPDAAPRGCKPSDVRCGL
jgi:eukaryotic-like serine/threonine-protein kinase